MWLNAQGNPVATGLAQISVTIPTEASADATAHQSAADNLVAVAKTGDIPATLAALWDLKPVLSGMNFFAVVVALVQLFMAFKNGNPTAIQAAIQALIDAVMGK